ncbi:MAG: 2-succinyl-6-hydroxy-2,4-cyclohexadiene-1-carboxylate synthase [Candidatus Limnocylindrales bacterium]
MSLNVLTAGSGPSMLLLHGFTGTARMWSNQIEAWSASHRVIAPDLLGHGGSAAPSDPAVYALERQADSLADLLVLLEATPAIVVGYSMGARLALVLALEHPASVARLILESPSAGIVDDRDRAARREADEQLAEVVERDGVDAFIARWEALPIFASHAELPADVRAHQRVERRRHTPAGLAASLRGAGQGAMSPLHERLSMVVAPSLVLGGALDPTGLARARAVAERLSNARLEVIAGAGHTPHIEAPDAFLRITNDFLAATTATIA